MTFNQQSTLRRPDAALYAGRQFISGRDDGHQLMMVFRLVGGPCHGRHYESYLHSAPSSVGVPYDEGDPCIHWYKWCDGALRWSHTDLRPGYEDDTQARVEEYMGRRLDAYLERISRLMKMDTVPWDAPAKATPIADVEATRVIMETPQP